MSTESAQAPQSFDAVEALLREGAEMRAFPSGARLRVFRVEHNGVLKAYGEYPWAEPALRILEDDAKAGGREYADVYGKIELHYLSGAVPVTVFDRAIVHGRSMKATMENGDVVIRAEVYDRKTDIHEIEVRSASLSAGIQVFEKHLAELLPEFAPKPMTDNETEVRHGV